MSGLFVLGASLAQNDKHFGAPTTHTLRPMAERCLGMQHHVSAHSSTSSLVRRTFPGGSLGSRAVSRGLSLTVRPVIRLWARFPRLPWPYRLVDRLGHIPSSVRGTRRQETRIAGRYAEITRAPRSREDRVIVYFHGGAFLVGGMRLHRSLISHVADAAEATVIAIQYRKLPRHPIAHAIQDGLAAYRHALSMGVRPDDVAFVGDSAGGFLTFAVAMEARREGLPMPSAIVAMSPLTCFDVEAKLRAPSWSACAVFTPRAVPAMLEMAAVAHARAELVEALQAPIDGVVAGLPRTLIQASSSELVTPDAERMAARLAAAGVPCELELWEGQAHVFQASMHVAPEAREAIARIGEFLRRSMGAPSA